MKHGVCFYVSNVIPYVSIECPCPNMHIIYIELLKCYLVVVYRPPSNSPNDNKLLVEFLLQFCPNKEILLLGDFNLPGIVWSSGTSIFDVLDPLSNLFLSCFNQLGLSQWVDFPTFILSGNTLDLILTSEHDRVGDVFPAPPLPGCNHTAVIFDYLYM